MMSPKRSAESLAGEICDRYCKFPFICRNQENLDSVCEACPLNELIKIAEGKNKNEGVITKKRGG